MNEQLSALIDDELALTEATHLLASVQSSKHLSEAWSQYHLIGDAMRGTPAFSADFKQNLMQKIDLEATVLSPSALGARAASPTAKTKLPASWSIAASVAAVMVVGWMAVQQQPMLGNDMKVAVFQPASIKSADVTPVVTEKTTVAEMKESIPTEYLIAHQAAVPSLSSYYIQPVNYAE